jgi:hypothetical protein
MRLLLPRFLFNIPVEGNRLYRAAISKPFSLLMPKRRVGDVKSLSDLPAYGNMTFGKSIFSAFLRPQ